MLNGLINLFLSSFIIMCMKGFTNGDGIGPGAKVKITIHFQIKAINIKCVWGEGGESKDDMKQPEKEIR